MLRIRQLLVLARLTAAEAIRQPIYLLLTTTCVILTGLAPFIKLHRFGEDGKLVRDTGLACHFVFGLFVAGYAACSSLAREMRSGTASAVLSKPVSREVFFLAKFLGIAGVTLAFSMCSITATLLAERAAEKFYFTNKLTGYIQDTGTGILLLLAPLAAYFIAGLINYLTK